METATLNLTKGEKVDLTKQNPGLIHINVGMGWDARTGSGDEFDLDSFACILKAGKLLRGDQSVIYFNHKHADGIDHQGDNLTGAGDGDDETIKVDLSKIPADADEVVFAANIYKSNERHERFGQVKNAYVRIYNNETNAEYLKFDLTEDYSNFTGVLMGKLYRHNGEWKFEAIGEGVNGEINQIVSRYE